MLGLKGVNLLKNPYSLSIPILASVSASSYSIYKDINFASSVEYISLARVKFNPINSTKLIRGESVNFSDNDTLNKLKEEDKFRLNNFYRQYSSSDLNVNASDDSVDFFVQIKSKTKDLNPNNLWLDNVHFNQLSIDRYGYEYESNGNKKGDKKIHKIVDWFDIDLSNMKYDSSSSLQNISFNFFNKDISKQEVEILMNENTKYKTDDGDSNDWLIWMDKKLLAVKMNYALMTHVFNQAIEKGFSTIQSIANDTDKKDKITKNWSSLTSVYKDFAENYLSLFLSSSDSSSHVTTLKTNDLYIKEDDINNIFNKFKSNQKSLEIFKFHLLSRISSGDVGNWRIALNLKKGSKEKEEPKQIDKLNSTSTNREENSIKIFIDSDINAALKLNDVYHLVKDYSVKNFDFKTSNLTSTYADSDLTRSDEILHVLNMEKKNEFGFYKNNYLIPFLLFLLFIGSIVAYLSKSFKVTGLIFSGGIVSGIFNVLSSFFALGSQLSLIGVSALLIGIFYSLFLSYYFLRLMRKLFDFEFLDKRNIWVLFKRGLMMSVDVTLPLFVFSTFIAFFAPLHLREFGIILSLCLIMFFVLITIFCNLISIGYIRSNFLNLKCKYSHSLNKSDLFYDKCCCGIYKNRTLVYSWWAFVSLLFAGSLVFFGLGLNSFSLFKNNYLVTFFSDSSALNIHTQIDQNTVKNTVSLPIQELLSSIKSFNSFLIGEGNVSNLTNLKNEFSNKLKTGNYYIQVIDSFKDLSDIKDLFISFGFSSIFVIIYILFRFKLKNLFIYIVNSLISFLVFLSLLMVLRVAVYSSIFVVICAFFAMSIVYHMTLFHIDRNRDMNWFSSISDSLLGSIYRDLRISFLLFLLFSLLTLSEEVIFINIYIFGAIFVLHFISTFIYSILSDRLRVLSDNYFRGNYKNVEVKDNYEIYNLDPYDEEIISGINKI